MPNLSPWLLIIPWTFLIERAQWVFSSYKHYGRALRKFSWWIPAVPSTLTMGKKNNKGGKGGGLPGSPSGGGGGGRAGSLSPRARAVPTESAKIAATTRTSPTRPPPTDGFLKKWLVPVITLAIAVGIGLGASARLDYLILRTLDVRLFLAGPPSFLPDPIINCSDNPACLTDRPCGVL